MPRSSKVHWTQTMSWLYSTSDGCGRTGSRSTRFTDNELGWVKKSRSLQKIETRQLFLENERIEIQEKVSVLEAEQAEV